MNSNIKMITKKYLIESLAGIPHRDNSDKFSIGRHLLIRDKATGIEYTVADIDIADESDPQITCYRYDPKDATTFYLNIDKSDFDKYELA